MLQLSFDCSRSSRSYWCPYSKVSIWRQAFNPTSQSAPQLCWLRWSSLLVSNIWIPGLIGEADVLLIDVLLRSTLSRNYTKRKQTCFHHQSQCLIYTALRWTGGWFSITLQTVHPYTWFINLNQTIWWLKTSKTIVLMLGSGYSTKSAFSCSNHWRVATKINNYRSLELKVSERNLHLRQHYRKQISVWTFISFWSRCSWK